MFKKVQEVGLFFCKKPEKSPTSKTEPTRGRIRIWTEAVVDGANPDVGAKLAGAEPYGDSNNGYVCFYTGGIGRNTVEQK